MSDLPRGLYLASDPVERPEKASQTLLSHIDQCGFSGYLYLKHKGGPQTPEMARGEAFHEMPEKAIQMLVENEEMEMPPDVGKDLMQAILEERVDLQVPTKEQDACRLMAWNWAAATVIDPEAIAGIEQMLELQVGKWTIRGKLDFLLRGDGWMTVKDWKTSLSFPSVADYEQSFQPQMYALLAMEGVPEGGGTPIGRGLSEVRCEEVYPRFRLNGSSKIEDWDTAPGAMMTRWATYDRPHLADFKRTVESLLAKLEHGLETGEWSAQESSHCGICPARGECPIPFASRQVKVIGTEGDAREFASRIAAGEASLKGDKAALKDWVREQGALTIGDEEWTFVLQPKENSNKEAIKELIRECGQDPADFYKQAPQTRFVKQKVEAPA